MTDRGSLADIITPATRGSWRDRLKILIDPRAEEPRVPEFLDVNGLYEDRDRLAEGEVLVIPLAELEDLRVRLLVTCERAR